MTTPALRLGQLEEKDEKTQTQEDEKQQNILTPTPSSLTSSSTTTSAAFTSSLTSSSPLLSTSSPSSSLSSSSTSPSPSPSPSPTLTAPGMILLDVESTKQHRHHRRKKKRQQRAAAGGGEGFVARENNEIPLVVGSGEEKQQDATSGEPKERKDKYWLAPAYSIPCTDRCCGWFCAFWMTPCVACQHRVDVLGDRWQERYTCCQNMYECIHPKCVFFNGLSAKYPRTCLCIESTMCAGLAVTGSRYQLNKDQGLVNRPFEQYTGYCLLCLELFFVPGPWSLLSRSLTGCMVIQQDEEMARRGYPNTFTSPGRAQKNERRPLLED